MKRCKKYERPIKFKIIVGKNQQARLRLFHTNAMEFVNMQNQIDAALKTRSQAYAALPNILRDPEEIRKALGHWILTDDNLLAIGEMILALHEVPAPHLNELCRPVARLTSQMLARIMDHATNGSGEASVIAAVQRTVPLAEVDAALVKWMGLFGVPFEMDYLQKKDITERMDYFLSAMAHAFKDAEKDARLWKLRFESLQKTATENQSKAIEALQK